MDGDRQVWRTGVSMQCRREWEMDGKERDKREKVGQLYS